MRVAWAAIRGRGRCCKAQAPSAQRTQPVGDAAPPCNRRYGDVTLNAGGSLPSNQRTK